MRKDRKLLFKLMAGGTNRLQFIGFAAANLIGAFILLFAFQSYVMIGEQIEQESGVFADRYLVIAKKVSGATTIFGGKGDFDLDEISEISKMDGVDACHPFQAAHFPVVGHVSAMGVSMSSELFLESVPDCCLDISDKDWKADIEGNRLPIIIPRSFLDLYNFGFASTQDMPLISESIIKRVQFNITLKGNGKEKTYTAGILGFTDRINTILVPDEFLSQANECFGSGKDWGKSSRLMIEAGGRADEKLIQALEDKGYVLERGQADSFKMLGFIRGVLVCGALVGLLITALAFYIMLISIRLILEKNKKETETLRKLGYPRTAVLRPYAKMTAVFNMSSWIIAMALVVPAFNAAAGFVSSSGIEISEPSYGAACLLAAAFALSFTALHHLITKHSIHNHSK